VKYDATNNLVLFVQLASCSIAMVRAVILNTSSSTTDEYLMKEDEILIDQIQTSILVLLRRLKSNNSRELSR